MNDSDSDPSSRETKSGLRMTTEKRRHFRLVSNDTMADFGYFDITNAGGIRCWINNSQIGFKRSP